jgi:hypothetical protein
MPPGAFTPARHDGLDHRHEHEAEIETVGRVGEVHAHREPQHLDQHLDDEDDREHVVAALQEVDEAAGHARALHRQA